MSSTEHRIPVVVISGYLGAGKTTWINQLLREHSGSPIAVLINDFGDINIDAALIAEHDGQTMSLTNGCVCCAIGGDLSKALRDARDRNPAQILLEASGVANPVSIANQARAWNAIKVAGIMCLFDPGTIEARSQDKFAGQTIRRQLRAADLLVMTHQDTANQARRTRAIEWLASLAPGTPVASAGLAPEQVLQALPAAVIGETTPKTLGTSGAHDFNSFVWQPTAAVSRKTFLDSAEHLRQRWWRCKGWLRFSDDPGRSCLVQATRDTVELTAHHITGQPELLQIIVSRQGQDEAFIRRALDQTCSTQHKP